MTFLGPTLPTLLAAAGAAATVLVGLYLLRPSRRRIDVPYARLWGLLVKEAQASAIARRLRRWESLLVQLVIAALLLLAIADPHLGAKTDRPRHVILVDTSASMVARDERSDTPRIELARRAAHRVVDSLSPDEEAMVVGFDSAPHTLSSLTSDETVLRSAIDRMAASASPDAIVPALSLAADALLGAGRKRLTLISDGALDDVALSSVRIGEEPGMLPLGDVDVRFEPVAPLLEKPNDTSENLAITAFSVRRYPSNRSSYELLVEVRSYSDRARHARLTIAQEGDPVEIAELDLPAHARVQKLLSDLSGEGTRLEATLTPSVPDALAIDDRAYALLPDLRRTKVQLVGDGDLYTEGALLLDRGLEVERRTPAQYDAEQAKSADALVFVGFTPSAPAPRPSLHLGCNGPGCPFSVRSTIDDPIPTESSKTHPIMRFLAMKDLNAVRTATFALEPGDVGLVSTLGRPFLVAGERNGLRRVALGFPPASSDLPLRVAFPVLLINSLSWLTDRSLDPVDSALTGHASRLVATHEPLRIESPDGSTVSLPVREGAAMFTPWQVGFHRAGEPDAQRLVAANLFDARESSIAGHPIVLAGKTLAPPSSIEHLRPRAALWRWLALVALLLVALEWWTYHRRWTV